MEPFSALLAIWAGNSPVPGEFPAPRSVTRSFDVSLTCTWINDWVNNREAGNYRRPLWRLRNDRTSNGNYLKQLWHILLTPICVTKSRCINVSYTYLKPVFVYPNCIYSFFCRSHFHLEGLGSFSWEVWSDWLFLKYRYYIHWLRAPAGRMRGSSFLLMGKITSDIYTQNGFTMPYSLLPVPSGSTHLITGFFKRIRQPYSYNGGHSESRRNRPGETATYGESWAMGLLPDTHNCGCACAGNAGNVFPVTAG